MSNGKFLDGLQSLGRKLKESKLGPLAGVILGETPVGKIGRIIKGAAEILGTDPDPDAITTAMENATADQRIALLELQAREIESDNETSRNMEDNVTSRHAADMASQSYLSANIRPVVTISLMVFFFLYVAATTVAAFIVFYHKGSLDQALIGLVTTLGFQLVGMLGTAIAFYFGFRGYENAKLGKPRDRHA
jgi:xanthine/CO dehydrogenase XdhC/CoxF family maturation factor